MTADPPHRAAQAEHLTQVLRRAGVLDGGRVAQVSIEGSRATVLSRIARLDLTYDGPAEGAPRRLFLKTAHPERMDKAWTAGRQEVAFYTDIAAAMPAGPVPRCFEAAWDPDTNDWHLLLEDLAQSHIAVTGWPLPPGIGRCERIVQAYARFHAAWWDDPRLGGTIGVRMPPQDTQAHFQHFAGQYAQFAERLGDRLPQHRRDLFQRFLNAAPDLWARHQSQRGVTIVHGDAHVWNCFLPRDEHSDDVRLFDWDSWQIGVATSDLAYMMAMHWYPDRRRQFERPLLDRYHAALVAAGVRGYDRRALDDDYRWSALVLIMRPVWQEAINIPPVIWWNNLERILLAVEDLGCDALINSRGP